MIRGITIACKGEDFSVLIGPEVSFVEQRRNFRKLRTHLKDFDEVELWSSSRGRVKRYRFKSKVQAVTPPTPPVVMDATSPVESSDSAASPVTEDVKLAKGKKSKVKK